MLLVIVRVEEPNVTGAPYMSFPVPVNMKLPPIIIVVGAKVLLFEDWIVPPFIVSAPLPKALLPVTITVPLFNVKPPVMFVVKVKAPRFKIPDPLFVMPAVLFAVTDWLVQVNVEPVPILKVRTELSILNVPAFVTVTVIPSLTVTFPMEVVAKFTDELALKIASLLLVQTVVNGPPADVPQFVEVQTARVPFVFQYTCPHPAFANTNSKIAVSQIVFVKFFIALYV